MAVSEQIDTVTNMFGSGLGVLGQYKIVLFVILGLAVVASIIYMVIQFRNKKKQWTHKIKVKRKLADGRITDPIIHLARRFPLQHGIEIFELEKPLLGGYLLPAPGEYTEVNTFSIILDENNRIWNDMGTKFNKSTQSLEVSAVHAGIDVERQVMKERWEQGHKASTKITTMELIKAGLKALGIVALVIIAIVAIGEWGDSQTARATMATAEADAMLNLATAVETMQKTVNTQQLQLVPMLKALYGTDNIAGQVRDYCNEENSTNA